MRQPTEAVIENYYQKHGYVRLRIIFQARGIGKTGYQGIKEQALTLKLPTPPLLWKMIRVIQLIAKRWEEEWTQTPQ